MTEVWERLKPALRRLVAQIDSPLQSYPDPDVDTARIPPFTISLWPWAVDAAADLHHRFGSDVDLTVGAMAYPAGTVDHTDGPGSGGPTCPPPPPSSSPSPSTPR